jgi:hypothetical protein
LVPDIDAMQYSHLQRLKYPTEMRILEDEVTMLPQNIRNQIVTSQNRYIIHTTAKSKN